MPLRNTVLSFQSVSCQFLVPLSVLRLYWGQRQIAENRLVLVGLCIVGGGGLRAAGWLGGKGTQRGIRGQRNVDICRPGAPPEKDDKPGKQQPHHKHPKKKSFPAQSSSQ